MSVIRSAPLAVFTNILAITLCSVSARVLADGSTEQSIAVETNTPSTTSAAENGSSLEEIVVTARKRSELLEKTPVSVTAFSGADLQQNVIQDLGDLQKETPSLQTSKTVVGPMGFYLSMRGQVESTIDITDSGSVGMYVDDVYQGGAKIAGSLKTLVDLSQVEVLKGPQGTLYGRNTTGGAIKFATALPTDNWDSYVELGTGNYDREYAEGMLNVPIVPGEADARIVGSYYSRNGFSFDPTLDRQLDDLHKGTVRGTLKLDPIEHFEILIRANFGEGHDNGTDNRTIYLQPGFNTGSMDIAAASGLLTPAQAFAALTSGGAILPAGVSAATLLSRINGLVSAQLSAPRDSVQEASAFLGIDTAEDSGASITMTYDLGSSLLESITAWQRSARNSEFNVGGWSWVPIFSDEDSSDVQITQELRISGQALENQRLKYTAGLYYFHTDLVDDRLPASIGGAFPLLLGNFGLGVTGPSIQTNEVADDSEAAYGQVTYAITDSVNVTGGLRGTIEHKSDTSSTLNQSGIALGSVLSCATYVGTTPPPVSDCLLTGSEQNKNVSYTFGPDWSVTDNTMLYAKTSRGFKAGGISDYPGPGVPLSTYKPEISTDYEIGIKSKWLENRVRTDLALYHTNYSNIQRETAENVDGNIVTPISNAAKAKIDGVEFDAEVVPFPNAKLGATMAYTDARYLSYSQFNAAYPNGVENLAAQPFQGLSKWTGSLSAGYDYRVSVGLLHTEVDWSYRSKNDLYPSDLEPTTPGGTNFAPLSVTTQAGYGLVDASMALNLAKYGVDIVAWGKNILNKRYYSSGLSLVNNGVGVTYANFGDPATCGIDIKKRF